MLARSSERLSGQQPLEERAVPLQSDAQVLGRDVLAPAPLALEGLALAREAVGELLHRVSSGTVGILDRTARIVDERDLDRLPAPAKLRPLVIREQLGLVVAGLTRGGALRPARPALPNGLGRGLWAGGRGRGGGCRVAVAAELVGLVECGSGGR